MEDAFVPFQMGFGDHTEVLPYVCQGDTGIEHRKICVHPIGPIFWQVRGVFAFDVGMVAHVQLERHYSEREPVSTLIELVLGGLSIPDSLHQSGSFVGGCLVGVYVDEEGYCVGLVGQKVHFVQVDDEDPLFVYLRHGGLHGTDELHDHLRRDVVVLLESFSEQTSQELCFMYIRHGETYRRIRFGIQEDISRSEYVFEARQALQLTDLTYGDHPFGIVVDFVGGAAFLADGTFSARGDVVTLS